ncbi:hypothetical protein, partial [Sphingomonas sp. Leaf339]|uniref:hypothetical protein n=1 Tax=Sphingomonas sp. Leaf339 TaxID=1736343 RepID=UPI001F320E31
MRFGDASSPRAFNGALNYVAAVPEPASWAMMRKNSDHIGSRVTIIGDCRTAIGRKLQMTDSGRPYHDQMPVLAFL